MWRWILVHLLTLSYTSTQPISDHEGRPTECCPCPKPGAPDMATLAAFNRPRFVDDCPCRADVRFSNPEGGFSGNGGADQALASSMGDGTFVRAGVVDDCPCRVRDADSMGAPSGFLPTAVRALWPVMSDKDPKEDPKPLLHPEVGLASSVLETLREATDEEYQEALARDAERSLSQAPDVDVVSDVSSALDTARNIVDVLLKPEDDSHTNNDPDSEASHVQESRCIHPLGRSKTLNLQFSPLTVNEAFTKPKNKPLNLLHKNNNIWDMDSNVGASNVHEQIIDGTGNNFEKLKFNSNPSLFSLLPKINNDETVQKINVKPLKENKKLFNRFKETDKSASSLDAINTSLSDLRQKLDNHLQSIKNDNADKLKNVLDSVTSPNVPNIVFKPLLPATKVDITTMKPLNLNSILNLKDVELIPPVKTSISNSNGLPVFDHKNKKSSQGIDLFKNFRTTDLSELISNGLKISLNNINNRKGTENIQPIPKGIFKSNTVDAETSPSEVKMTITNKEKNSENCDTNSWQTGNSDNIPKTKRPEILETVPSKIKQKSMTITITNDNESADGNFNDLPKSVNKMGNTEIIDTIPSPSQIESVEVTDEGEDSERKDVSREESDCELDNTEENDSTSINNSDGSDRDNISNGEFENNNENSDETNFTDDSDMRTIDSEETCFEDSVDQQDTVPDNSNNSPKVFETDDQRSDSDIVPDDGNSKEDCVDDIHNQKSVIDTKQRDENIEFNRLNLLKEDILRKLNKLKNPNNKINEEGSRKCEDERNTDTNKTVALDNVTSKTLEMQDLQNMSDKLLDLSNKKDQVVDTSEKVSCKNDHISTVTNSDIENVDDNRSMNDIEEISQSTEDVENNVPEFGSTTEKIIEHDEDVNKQFSCTSNLDTKINSVSRNNLNNEMIGDASNPFINKVVPESGNKPSLLHNILRPTDKSSLQGIHLNVKDKILDFKLPKLNNIEENLSSILQPNFDLFNNDEQSIVDYSNTMSGDASTPTLASVLPKFQPLENIDLDIFQLRPLLGPHELLSKVPRLNFNNYKAKLAVPKGFHLKPMKLESSLGDKNGLLGAALTVGSDKPFRTGSSLFSGPLGFNNLPSLEELHSNMRENAQNLLLTPLDITGRNLIDDSLRSTQTLTDNIRSHAKNTMKDIHQSFETTLKDVKQSDLGILADPLRDPKEFFEAMSRTHEDVSDKLKAIHYDLNDRLESIRDRITDQSLLPTLSMPMQSTLTFGPEKIKERTSFSSSYSKPGKKLKAIVKSKPQTISRASSRKKPIRNKNIKMPAAPSINVPKTVKAPKLRTVTTSSPPPFILKYPSLRTSSLLTNKNPITDFLHEPVSNFRDNTRVPVLGKFKPAENKVKISFGSTTLRPDFTIKKPNIGFRPTVPRRPILSTKLKGGDSKIGSKLRPFDTNGAPSEIASTRLKPPVITERIEEQRPLNKINSGLTKSRPIMIKSIPLNNDSKFTNAHGGRQFSPDKSAKESNNPTLANSRPLGSPKNGDILASLREAVRARLSNITPLNNDKIVQPTNIQSDMLRSASENVVSTNVDRLMKENASYTCKMMCTRNH